MSRMGANQSVQIQSATDAQKERVGVFSLRGTQKHTLEILATLLDQLLRENNLFNLSAMLGSPDRCNELFVILSSTLKNEFKTLRLPDPGHPGELHAVSYITKDAYKLLESESTRKKLCDDIAWFIIRVVTLVAALTASVSRNKEMISLTSDSQTASIPHTMNPRFQTPKLTIENRESLSEDTLKLLKTITYVLVPGTADVKDPRNLFYFDGTGSVVVDARRRIVYMPLGSETRVMEIRFDQQPDYVRGPVAAPIAYAQPAYQPAAQPAYQPVAAYQLPKPDIVEQARLAAAANQQRRTDAAVQAQQQATKAASVSGSSASSVPIDFGEAQTQTTRPNSAVSRDYMGVPRPVARRNSRTHRRGPKGRKATRKARKQRGGEGEVFFLVTLKDSICSEAPECEIVKFYMDSNGQTMDTETYRQFQARTMGGLPQTMSFTDRVKPILEKSGVKKVPLEPPAEYQTSVKTEFTALFNMSLKTLGLDTYSTLSKVKDNVLKATEGASPAQYRAFLLASNIDSEDFLQTLFCNDRWATLRGSSSDAVSGRTTNVVSYALLNALYYDRQEGAMETLTASECASKVAEFIGAKTLASAAQPGSPVLTFENAKFLDIPPALKAFCEQINAAKKGARRTRSTEDKAILMDAHRQLRELYDDQIKAVVEIIRKVMIPKNAGYGNLPILVLSETFATDTRGAMVVLEEIVKEGRNLLANHYLAVEKVYRTALSKLKERVEGVYTPNVKPNTPKVTDEPENM